MKEEQCDKGLDTPMMLWLRHLQCVTKTISITHMLLFAYLQTRIFNQQEKQHAGRERNHLLHEIPSFQIFSHSTFHFPKILYTILIFCFPKAVVFILVLYSITHFSKKGGSLIHAINIWGVLGLPHAFPETVGRQQEASHVNSTQCLLLQF